MTTPSLTSQIAALEAVIAIAFDGKPKPKGSQAEYLRAQAMAGVETVRRASQLPEDFLIRARFYVKGAGE